MITPKYRSKLSGKLYDAWPNVDMCSRPGWLAEAVVDGTLTHAGCGVIVLRREETHCYVQPGYWLLRNDAGDIDYLHPATFSEMFEYVS